MDTEIQIMEHLATYTYLSKSQLVRLGISVSDKTLYKALARLRESACGCIATRSFAPHPKYGAREDIHYLKPRGRKYLIEQQKWQPGHITIPIGSSRFYNDYDHRKKTIWLQLVLSRLFVESGWSVLRYTNYFTGNKKESGKGRESSTKIVVGNSFLRADSIIHVHKQDKQQLFCLEVHNGFDVVRIVDQLKHYGKALAVGTPSSKYNLTFGCRVLVIYEYEHVMNATLERVQDDPFFRHLTSYFLLQHYDQIKAQSSCSWLDLNKQHISLIK